MNRALADSPECMVHAASLVAIDSAFLGAILLLLASAALAAQSGRLLDSGRLRALAWGLSTAAVISAVAYAAAGAGGLVLLLPATAQAALLVWLVAPAVPIPRWVHIGGVCAVLAIPLLPEAVAVAPIAVGALGALFFQARGAWSPLLVVSSLFLAAGALGWSVDKPVLALGLWLAAAVALSLRLMSVLADASRTGQLALASFRTFPEPLVLVARDGKVITANRAAQLSTAARCGEDSHRHLHADETAPMACDICSWVASADAPVSFLILLRGRRHLLSVVPLGVGPSSSVLQLLRDREDRLRADVARARMDSRYQAMIENAYEGIAVAKPNGDLIEVNGRMAELTGYDTAQLLSRSVHDLHPASDQLRLRQLFSRLATGERVKAELAFLRPDGSLLPVEVSAAAQSMQGEIYYIGGFRDISARVQAETALRQSEARQRAIFKYAGTGIEVSALDGTILEVNHAFLNMHGWALDEVIGRDRRALMHPEDKSRNNDNRALMAQTRAGPQQATVRRLRKTGAAFWADVTLTAVSYGDGRDLLVALIQDVDVRHQADEDRRRHAADLQAAWQAAEQASAAKTRFLATASHDLRQPIQAVQLLVHLLAQQDVGTEAATLVARIREVFNALGGIIDALLDISKLDAGLVQPDWETCRLGPLLRQVVAEFGPLAAEKGLSLRAVHTRAVVLTDRGLLTRILRNLVANALRYTDRGGIVVGCRRYAAGLELCVVDTGCGIADDQRSEIFREFHQLGNAARDRREGLGLGLAIVDRLARLLECRITVRSRLGRGTCFGIGLRRAAPGGEMLPAADQLRLPMAYGGELILVVEDEADIRESLGKVLRAWGYRVALAADGEAALGCLNPADPPTLLLVDYRLGDMSGVEFVNAARRRLRTNLCALLLTGDAAAECRREAVGSNIALLYKPVQPDKLREELACITSSRLPQRKRYPAAAMRRELADYQDDL